MSTEQKREILRIFDQDLHLKAGQARDLLTVGAHLLGKGEEVHADPDKVLAASKEKFTDYQRESAIFLLQRVSEIERAPSERQRHLLQGFRAAFPGPKVHGGSW